jgi:L-cysteine/cystine lyase
VPDPAAFRSEFPVLDRLEYLNAGTTGPIPRRAAEAAAAQLAADAADGRSGNDYFGAVVEASERLRARYAALLGCAPIEVGLTRSATDGVNTALGVLELRAGDEVLTSDEEHPGVSAPLALAARRQGIEVRVAPFASLADAVGPRTRLVATSHVSWVSGRVVDSAALAATGASVLLDGAQGLGAVAVDVRALGCDFYAASGQKWLCGPEGTGCLYVRESLCADAPPTWPTYMSLSDPGRAEELPPKPAAARFDMGLPAVHLAWAHASLEVLEEAGVDWVHERAVGLAARFASDLAGRGLEVAPRDASTLVAWHDADAAASVERLRAEGFVVRDLPGRGLVRASVGAWSSEEALERLAGLA